MVRPILSFLARAAEEPLVFETDLTDEEKAIVEKGRRERVECPKSFAPWAEGRRG
jgi:hypothetical protein